MTYAHRFELSDEYLIHTDDLMNALNDDFIKSRYLGFIAVSAVTSYELAIKDIIYEFSDRKHRALGALARSKFDRLNGRIMLSDLRSQHIKSFGMKYLTRFDRILSECERQSLANEGGSVKSSYGNLITWRHQFVHEGTWPNTATYGDLRSAYENGKDVINCLASCLVR